MRPGHRVDELFTGDGAGQLGTLHDDLTRTGRYLAVITPLVALHYDDVLVQGPAAGGDPTKSIAGQTLVTALNKEPAGSAQAKARQQDALTTLSRLNTIPAGQRTLTNPAWVRFLLYDGSGAVRLPLRPFFPDPTHAQVLVRLKGNLSIADEGRDAVFAKQRISRLSLPGSVVTATGASLLLKDINDYLRGGMLLLGGIAIAIMVVILLVLFNVRWRLLPLGVILVGVIWAFGLAGYVGVPLTVVTIAGLPVMLGVGIDYAIQMHARIEEEAVLGVAEHPVQATARGLCPALLVVTFDAIFAFAALHFAKVPMIRSFGLLLAVGIAAICICSIMAPLAILGIREFRSPTRPRDFHEGSLGKLVLRLGSLPQALAIPLVVLSIAIFAGGLAVEGKLNLQTDPIQWVNQHSGTIKDIHTVQREVHSSSELGVYVTGAQLFSDESVRYLHDFRRDEMARFGPSGTVSPGQFVIATSAEAILGDLMVVPGASDMAPTGAEVKAAYDAAPADIQASVMKRDGTAANVIFAVAPGSLTVLDRTVKAIRADAAPPPGIRATPSGLAVVGTGLLDNLESNRILLTYLAMLFVFLFLAVRLRSVVRALLSLVPVAIAVGTASLVAYVFNFNLSPMTAVGGPLVIAACTEFTSLILLRFVEERGHGLEPQQAVDVAASRTGRAFIVSALTAIAGVAVLSFSSLPLLRDFGRIVAMNVAVALFSALVILPPLLVWADADRRNWVSRGLIRPEEPFLETPPRPSLAPAE
jgi:hydrophobe/amphiphile efflux-3 (HAE3) family protein